MAAAKNTDELEEFRKSLRSTDNEDARRPLLYPLFKKLYGDKMKIESAANGADIYIEGKLLVEVKTDSSQWVEGFFQALHYQRRFGMGYDTVMVIAHQFVGIWKLNKLPEYATILSRTSSAHKAPNVVGKEKITTNLKKIKNRIVLTKI